MTYFWAPSLEQGVNVPSSGRAHRSSQSGSLPREGHGHSVLPQRAPGQEQHVGLQPCDRAAAQVTADMASRRIRAGPREQLSWGLSLGGYRAMQHRGRPPGTASPASQCVLLPSGWERLKSQLPLTSLPLPGCPRGPLFDAAVRN